MDGSDLGGGYFLGPNGQFFGMEKPPMTSHQSRQLHPIECIDFGKSKGKGTSLVHSCNNNSSSEEDEPSFIQGINGENTRKKRSPWQRMKWTDEIVRLLIAVVSSVGDDGIHETIDGPKRKCGALQKKGKWKMVSNIMISKGSCVSPQQCEDKFNDLNKRYKKLNDILGRGISCQVVENPSLMESMPHLTDNAKDEVKKILGSKHLFYREMCAYHNGQKIPGCHDIDLRAHLMPLDTRSNDNVGSERENGDTSEESDDNDSYENVVEPKTGKMDVFSSRNAENKERIRYQIWQLEGERVKLEVEALDLEKQRSKWLRFRCKKDRELERLRLENERMKLENERMVLVLRQKKLEIDSRKLEKSPEHAFSSA